MIDVDMLARRDGAFDSFEKGKGEKEWDVIMIVWFGIDLRQIG